MKTRILLFALLALVCFSSSADEFTWNYEEDFAKVMSTTNYVTDNGELEGAALIIGIMHDKTGKTFALIQIAGKIAGEDVVFNFTQKRDYIVVRKTVISDKITFKVLPHPKGRKDVIIIKDAERFVKLLKSTDQLHISTPVYGRGSETYDFYFGDYPLEWD